MSVIVVTDTEWKNVYVSLYVGAESSLRLSYLSHFGCTLIRMDCVTPYSELTFAPDDVRERNRPATIKWFSNSVDI